MKLRLLGMLFTYSLVLCLPGVASAQMTGNIDKLKADLYGDNLDTAVAAASALGSLKEQPRALDALMASLQLGTPPKLTSAVLEALELHANPEAIPLLAHYAKHRRQEIRGGALKALGAIKSKDVVAMLIEALSDSNPMIRAQAARILGERKERIAERSLMMMLRRKDTSAAVPLGIIGGAQTALNLAEMIGIIPGPARANALGTMLMRKDFGPDPLRTQVVKALGNIQGKEATSALAEYVASVPPNELRQSKNQAKLILEKRK